MSPWKTLSRQVILDRKPHVQVTQQKVETDSGQIVPDFYQVDLGTFVVCVPMRSDGTVVTLRTYKHGAGRVSTTFPAGKVDDGEAPEMAMARELLEETGYKAGQLVPLGRFVDNGNQIGTVGHYYIGLDCAQVQDPDDGDLETMQLELRAPDEIEDEIFSGEIPILHHAAAWLLARAWIARGNADETRGTGA